MNKENLKNTQNLFDPASLVYPLIISSLKPLYRNSLRPNLQIQSKILNQVLTIKIF